MAWKKASEIKRMLRSGEFLLTIHAASRMSQDDRDVTESDIMELGRTATKIVEIEDAKWKVEGRDSCGLYLCIVCRKKDNLVIITVITGF